MADTLIERAWAWLHATFPERQVYIRSDGRVQFFTFGPTLQATLAGLALIFLGWVAFASVNVIFKDRIIAAKDHRYQQMQSTYENRVADLQLSYDELNGALVSAEDKFKSVADELQAKQQTVARLLTQKDVVDSTLAGIRGGTQVVGPHADDDGSDVPLASKNTNLGSDSISGDGPSGGPDEHDASPPAGASELSINPPSTAPHITKPQKSSFLDRTVGRLASALFAGKPHPHFTGKAPNLPAFHVLALETQRVRSMSRSETALLVGVDHQVYTRIGAVEAVLSRVGLNPDKMEDSVASREGEGGPLIPLSEMHIDGISDAGFVTAYGEASAHARELADLFAGLSHVPLTTPVHGSDFDVTSGFGARVDPFTHHLAFHSGMDFAGPWGSTVCSTAPGVVAFAGERGGYGNMVEIDHGFGIRTRYGHLSSILVKVGAKVSKGTPIGKLGSTGRSTGPHVHYEVWLADVVRDPSRFIEAGRHVLQ
jgi:murein DD-endopeptidase MepM/ murein hydrolase activator NlpD